MFGSNCRIICGASVSRFTEHFGPCSSLPISACSRAIYAVYTGHRDDCRGAGRAYSKICHFRRTDLLLTRNIDGGPFGCVASQSQKAGITLREGAFKQQQQQQQQSGGWGVFWGSFEDRIRVDPLCLWRVGPLHLQVQTRSSAATPVGCVAKMLTVEEVYKNTVLPSQIINVSTIDSVLGRPIYTKLNGVSSDVEVDPVNVPVKGNQNIWSSTANISRLQSDSVTELKRFPRRTPLSKAEHRRRRTTSDPSLFVCGGGLTRQSSLREFGNDVQHAASETYLITRLTFTLLRYLGVGTRWIGKLIRLGLYALFLMPGFIQVGFFYYFSKCVHRSIVYGNQPRNRLDLYMPPESDKPKPVVIFVTGGAWIIGYKAWGSLLAQQLVERDIIVACIDYRNFPQGSISDMVSDISTGIGFVFENAACYGGDPNKLYLAGQSAGAHLAACALVMQAKEEATQDPTKLSWRSSQLRAYMAISGGYNLIKLVEHFHKRGLYKSIFYSVMEGEASLPLYSPEYMVMSPSFKDAVPLLPPITLFHGTADYSIRHDASVAFGVALTLVGAKSKTVLYRNKTHTDLFLQDPMRGGKDDLLADILAIVHEDDAEARTEDSAAMERRRLVPEILLQLARLVSPF